MPKNDVNNSALLDAMAAVRDGMDEAKLRALYRALRDATVVIISAKSDVKLGETPVFVPTYRHESGIGILIAYTGFDVAPADRPRMWIPFVELCRQLVSSGLAVVINPGPHSGAAPTHWVRAIAEGAAEMPDPVLSFVKTIKDVEVVPGLDASTEIRERLNQALAATRGIIEAHLSYVTTSVGGQPIPTLCVVVTPAVIAERVPIATELHAWVNPLLSGEFFFLVVPPEDKIVAKFKAVGRPLYRNPAN